MMHLLCYCQGSYRSQLVKQLKHCLIDNINAKGIHSVTIIFDESSVVVAAPMFQVKLERKRSGLIVKSNRISQQGSRNSSEEVFEKILGTHSPEFVAIDKKCSYLNFRLNNYSPEYMPKGKLKLSELTSHYVLQGIQNLFNIFYLNLASTSKSI